MMAGAAIVMPKLGLTMTEGLLASWRVAPGDAVKSGDVLFVVETEKVATDIAADADGRIKDILVGEGETAPVGAVVATWFAPSTVALERTKASPGQNRASSESASAPALTAAREAGARIIATPFARRRAREKGVDLGVVVGSGPNGRIKAADVAAAARPPLEIPEARPTSAPPPGRESGAFGHGDSRRPASAVGKVAARRLALSKQTIPHFYVLGEADVTNLLAFRERMNKDETAPRLSITHFIIAAVARALARAPEVNALWRDDEIVTLAQIDIGLAVDTERGLLAPVLRDLARAGVEQIAQAAGALAKKAREGRLQASELEGGAISISNVGMVGASHLVPIINPGQSAILGVAAVRPAFRPDEAGAPKLCQELGLVLSADHRLWDGVRAARFLDSIAHFLEHPLLLLR
jgi:pyruvate dehydrogenase E2 component (dihydrolipoamide acetyltransferase)